MNAKAFGIFLLFLPFSPADADHRPCDHAICPLEVDLVSIAKSKSYGLLLGAPSQGCKRVRFRVETQAHDLLGKTPVLKSGEISVLRLGQGFAEGSNKLLVTAEGCNARPSQARRVALRKSSPDHGWRAGLTAVLMVTSR